MLEFPYTEIAVVDLMRYFAKYKFTLIIKKKKIQRR